jgi:hypothetical protein
MKPKALHTQIVDLKKTNEITVVREDPDNYPKGKSNIYAKNEEGEILWFSELPVTGDSYCNPIQWCKDINSESTCWNSFYKNNPNSFVVSSWNCYTVSIDIRNGKIINKVFTK